MIGPQHAQIQYQNRSTPMSQNAKLGNGVATNYRPVGDSATGAGTCPSNCAMLNNGCYADKALVKMQALKSRTQFDSLSRLLEKGALFVRLHTSGDFFRSDSEGGYMLDMFYWADIIQLVKANPHVTFWTYCHDVSKLVEAGFDYLSNLIPSNLHITASVDTAIQRQYAKSHGFRTARVIKALEDKIHGEVYCPYDHQLFHHKSRTIKCVDCKLCFNPANTKDIAFLLHK